MASWTTLTELFERLTHPGAHAGNLREEDLRLADEARRLIREAIVRDHGAVDLHRFTSVLCAQLDQDGRKQIIEMLWEIAMADCVVHEFESNLVWRVAELLGVSARDRELLRKTVASRRGLEAES
jgi:uncharacterized tellurite resistance protein B-like protein